MERVVVDVQTGEVKIVPLTPEEIAEIEAAQQQQQPQLDEQA